MQMWGGGNPPIVFNPALIKAIYKPGPDQHPRPAAVRGQLQPRPVRGAVRRPAGQPAAQRAGHRQGDPRRRRHRHDPGRLRRRLGEARRARGRVRGRRRAAREGDGGRRAERHDPDLRLDADRPREHHQGAPGRHGLLADGRRLAGRRRRPGRSRRSRSRASRCPIARRRRHGSPGGERIFHLQALRPRGDGTFQVLRSSQAFLLPPKATDPQTITTYAPENFCIAAGDVLVFNTVGGWDGIVTGTGPFPTARRCRSSRASRRGRVGVLGAQRDGQRRRPQAEHAPGQGHELLMQLTLGTGPNATALCPGGTAG